MVVVSVRLRVRVSIQESGSQEFEAEISGISWNLQGRNCAELEEKLDLSIFAEIGKRIWEAGGGEGGQN